MKLSVSRNAIFALFVLLAGFAISAAGQVDQGRIAGTIVDPAGGVIPGATVTVTNDITGETRTTITKENGAFIIVALKPSKYSISASANGFETSTKNDVDLPVF